MSQEVLEKMGKAGVIPIVVIEDPSKAVPLGKTLLDAGLDLIEITMRTKRAMDAIKILSRELPHLLIGAGTIFSVPIAKEAITSGARFIVSPHLDEKIVTYCADKDIVVMPGVFTPTEVNRAIKAATKNKQYPTIKEIPLAIKIFPASTGGPEHIKAMKAVFPDVRFVPLGGVNATTLSDYLRVGVWAVGGTWICKKDLIDKGDFAKISELAKEALRIVSEIRKQ